MKNIFIAAFTTAVLFAQSVEAQEITLDKIYSGYYRGKGISGIASLKNVKIMP